MDFPSNSAYGPEKKIKETPHAVTVLGYRIPGEQVWIVTAGLFGVLVFLCMIVIFLLPSGIPYLAAKFSDGFFSYIFLFFTYMFGFFAVMVVFFALLALVGLYANRLYR